MNTEQQTRLLRLQRVRISLQRQLLSQPYVYVLQRRRADPWMTDAEWEAIVNELVESGVADRVTGTLGGEKLMHTGERVTHA
jgi:hypothetical protein